MYLYSKTITSETAQTYAALRVEARYLRIPVNWSVEEMPGGVTDDERYALVPSVDQSTNWRPVPLDLFKLRNLFLKLDIDDDKQTLDFLNYVGVWNINPTGEDFMRIERPVGHSYVAGYASLFTVGALKQAQCDARFLVDQLVKDRRKLRAWFGPPPSTPDKDELLAHAAKNRVLNTLPLHIEWRNDKQIGVIQAVTGRQMLNVALQLNLMTGTPGQVCQRCGIPFTADRQKLYCDSLCARAMAQKGYRDREREKKAKGRKWRKTV